MAKMKMSPKKVPFKQETYQPVIKGKIGELTLKKATKLKSDRKKP